MTFSVTPRGDTRPLSRTCGVGSLVSRGNTNTAPWDAELKYSLPEVQSQSMPWMSSARNEGHQCHMLPFPHAKAVTVGGIQAPAIPTRLGIPYMFLALPHIFTHHMVTIISLCSRSYIVCYSVCRSGKMASLCNLAGTYMAWRMLRLSCVPIYGMPLNRLAIGNRPMQCQWVGMII